MSTTGNGRPPRQLGGMHTTRQGRRSQRGGCLVSQAGRAGPGLALASTWSGTVWVRAPQDALRPTFLPRPQGGTPRRRTAPAGTGATDHGTQLWQWPLLTGLQCGRGSLPGPRTQLGRHPWCSHGNGHQANCPRTRAQAPWRRPPLVPPRSWPPPGSRAMASCKATARRPDCPARPGACLWGFHGANWRRTLLPSGLQRSRIRPGTGPSPACSPRAVPSHSSPGDHRDRCSIAKRVPLDGSIAPEMPTCPSPRSIPSALCGGKNAKGAPHMALQHLGRFGPTLAHLRTLSLADGTRQGPSTSLPS